MSIIIVNKMMLLSIDIKYIYYGIDLLLLLVCVGFVVRIIYNRKINVIIVFFCVNGNEWVE